MGQNVGHRAEGLRTLAGFHMAAVQARKSGETYQLVTTQEHHTLEEPITHLMRTDIVKELPVEEYAKEPGVLHEEHGEPVQDMFAGWDYSKGYQWGMSIDLNACTGCNASIKSRLPLLSRVNAASILFTTRNLSRSMCG